MADRVFEIDLVDFLLRQRFVRREIAYPRGDVYREPLIEQLTPASGRPVLLVVRP